MMASKSDLILARLNDLHPKSIDLSLDRLQSLLADLDHPERKLPPVVHIAGTNGKGSTLAMLDAMLRADGMITHRYVSPHLVHFNERILINGAPIDEAMLASDLEHCEAVNGGREITFFEITTAAAFLAFSREPADIVLLETGLGGRLDATNVVDRPLLTLISPISLDHQSYLGDTIEAIAFEKAGIIKRRTPCLVGVQSRAAFDVLKRRAFELEAPMRVQSIDWHVEATEQGLCYRDRDFRHLFPFPALEGPHQYDNAGLAIAAARALRDLTVSTDAIEAGLREATWPARFQPIEHPPWLAKLPPGSIIRLDGGHNEAAGKALAKALDTETGMATHIIVGMLTTKDVGLFLRPLLAHAVKIWAVPIEEDHSAYRPDDIVAALPGGVDAETSENPLDAIDRIAAEATGPVRIVICGSLYLAGEVLREIA
jgi:dihydrofolate synthase/folylpolyglutamate synthase